MKVKLKSTHGDLNYVGINERGQMIQLSGSKNAVSPMESVLIAAAGCSAVDVELILAKMRQPFTHIEVDVVGSRADAVPAVFTDIHLHYKLFGNIKDDKARQAVDMSIEKYCSVSKMLQASVKITHSHEVIEELNGFSQMG